MIKCVEPTMIRENRVYICICVKKKPKNAYVDIVDEGRERGSPLVLFVRRGAEGLEFQKTLPSNCLWVRSLENK